MSFVRNFDSHEKFLNLRLFDTTKTLDSTIATPATKGDNLPDIARGIAAML